MTLNKGQQAAIILTEQDMKPIWQTILNSYRAAYKDIDAELANTYAKYLSTADPQDYYNIMIKFDRLTKLQDQVAKTYTAYSKKAGLNTAISSEIAMSNSYYRAQYTLDWFSPSADVALSFTALDPRLIEASVYGTEKAWKDIQAKSLDKYGSRALYMPQSGSLTERLVKNRTAELAKLKEALTSGLIQGKSYTKITADVKSIIGSEAGGKLTGAKGSAARIVRTEGTRNLNAGALANMHAAEAQGLNQQKMWVASLDSKTRGTHQSADGQKVGLDEKFHVGSSSGQAPGQMSVAGENIRCRCDIVSLIDGVDPQIRAGINPNTGEREIFDYKDFNQWAMSNGLELDKNGVWG